MFSLQAQRNKSSNQFNQMEEFKTKILSSCHPVSIHGVGFETQRHCMDDQLVVPS